MATDLMGFPTATVATTAEVDIWKALIAKLGGTIGANEVSIASTLSTAMAAASYSAKILYLLPFLGDNIKAHRVPLRDTNCLGAAHNVGFVDADCTTAGGIANPTEAAKYLSVGISPMQLGSGTNAGVGFYERNWGAGSGVEPIGCYDAASGTSRFVLDLRSTIQRFRWGATANTAGPASTASSAHYYGQRSSATLREIYKDGASLGSNSTTSDSAVSYHSLFIMGNNTGGTPTYWKGRCGCAYLTDGSMTAAEIADLHSLLATYLITATGR